MADLFSASWETRHGVATALRHIIRVQGRGGGKATYHTKQQVGEEVFLRGLLYEVIILSCFQNIKEQTVKITQTPEVFAKLCREAGKFKRVY